jgi:xylulokinase
VYLGVDLGTSSVKAALSRDGRTVLATAAEALEVERSQPGWSEQRPQAWLRAACDALDRLAREYPAEMAEVAGVGLAGQMHGAVLLDERDEVIRPAILWNDGRAASECAEFERALDDSRVAVANTAMPGLTAPKLLWVRRHEPEHFRRVRRVLLPKSWLRLALTGEAIEDMSDASGTLWLDVAQRDWCDDALAACGLDRGHMPSLVEGTAPSGRLRAQYARRWGMRSSPVLAGGAGDNAAGALALGAIHDGDAFLSIGTSGVVWVTAGRMPEPGPAIHTFCHALPGAWHQMGVILSAASAFAWLAGVVGVPPDELARRVGRPERPGRVLFAPYLSGERTPHNDATVRAAFHGLGHEHDARDLAQAVMEGVAFAFTDARDALAASGSVFSAATVIGGGSAAAEWIAIFADVLGTTLHTVDGGEYGAALGAARLGRIAATGAAPDEVCVTPRHLRTFVPNADRHAAYDERLGAWRSMYPALRAISERP